MDYKSEWKEFLEKISVLQWMLTFLFMGVSFLLLLVYLMFTSLWVVPVLYFTWIVLDWDTPERGGRPSAWVRGWAVWKHFRDYCPITLVKTAELSPGRHYVLGSHPHGIMCLGVFCCFGTNAAGFPHLFPGLRPHLATLAGLFRLPVYREYLMTSGMCPVSKKSLQYLLSQPGGGNAVVIVVGGAAESLTCRPGLHSLVIRDRKGFVRLALQYGAALVPVYSFGENDVFEQVLLEEGSLGRWLQGMVRRVLGFAPCLFKGGTWGFLPYRTPITIVVGSPIPVPKLFCPPQETVDHYHQLYIEALEKLFHAHKTQCGLRPTDQLQII
ncbi:2-acylglycerol O-acyltransferase 3b isoform X2 [Amia ocellicauda]